jgi:hypothetical protein
MVDQRNARQSTLQVIMNNPSLFVVTDKINTATPWSVLVKVAIDGKLDFDSAAIPSVSKTEVLRRYAERHEDWLGFQPVSGCPCDDFEQALIYYLVMEWFHFG